MTSVASADMPDGPMATQLRTEMSKEVNFMVQFERCALGAMPPVVPRDQKVGRPLVDHFSLESICGKGVAAKAKVSTPLHAIDRMSDCEQPTQNLRAGQSMVIKEGGYGLF
jgi:hypothetical protein